MFTKQLTLKNDLNRCLKLTKTLNFLFCGSIEMLSRVLTLRTKGAQAIAVNH